MALRVENCDTVEELSSLDVIDSRDMEERIEALESEEEDANAEPEEGEPKPEPMDPDHAELLKALREVRDACGREWKYGVGYVRESYWEDYCWEMADDLGYVKSGDSNPLLQCIDWKQWAELVAQDYSTVEIDGVTFYYRD